MGEGDANVANLKWATGELIASAGQLGGTGGPPSLKHVEWMFKGRFHPHLGDVRNMSSFLFSTITGFVYLTERSS